MSANYIDHRLSQKATSEFRRVVSGKTDITPMSNGRERRNAAWQFKKMKFTASFALMSPEAQDEVVGAFYACNAMLLLFRFRDPGDYYAEDSPLAVVAGTSDPVQLTKRYSFGPAYADRTIQAVTSCYVKDSHGNIVPGTIDNALGIFTPTSVWGSGPHTWSGAFDLWVRFNSDDLDMSMKNIDLSTVDVELSEQVATNNITGS